MPPNIAIIAPAAVLDQMDRAMAAALAELPADPAEWRERMVSLCQQLKNDLPAPPAYAVVRITGVQ